ncbi:unnamed protein product [Polarella glacialis]|uniref:Uncharacterized protein n=1 Tax=Polarella glacialis TaxID=89957 RepID=A0A813H228_POLGL|nr:unnamed protein product [Polarella glacialis]
MDKICRGSRVGNAHNLGTWDQMDHAKSRFGRGSHVAMTHNKLDNTAPPQRLSLSRSRSTDTFRSQEWFRHDGIAKDGPGRSPSITSPRFARGAFGMSPASSPTSRRGMQKSFSSRSFGEERGTAASLFYPDGLGPRSPRSPRSPQGKVDAAGVRPLGRGRSEGDLQRVEMNERALSPRDCLFQDRGPNRKDARSPSADGRAKSPTFCSSEHWMGYSYANAPPPQVEVQKMMPSSNFMSKIRRSHSGKITQNSENWLRVAGEDAKPTPPVIANSTNFLISRGKKVGLRSDADLAKKLMYVGPDSVPDSARTNRRHAFPSTPQADRHVEGLLQLSPRLLDHAATSDAVRNKSSRGMTPVPSARVAVQHRTSGEMAGSIMPEASTAQSPRILAQSPRNGAEKYLIGSELVDLQSSGRRPSMLCSAFAAKEGPPQRSSSQVIMRHHMNSDVVREHFQSVQFVPGCSNHMPPTREEANRRVHIYGDYSVFPSSMPKDTAYVTMGLKVVKYQTRSPGVFSPNAPRVPAMKQAL